MSSRLLTVSIAPFYIKEDGDLRKCYVCDDKIFGKMHTLVLMINESTFNECLSICDSCRGLFSDEWC